MQTQKFNLLALTATPTLPGAATSSGDVLIATTALTPTLPRGSHIEIVGATVLDKDDEALALDLVLLTADVSLGTVNSAVSISDSDAESVARIVSVEADDYVDLINSQFADKDLGKPLNVKAGVLYLGIIDRGGRSSNTDGSLKVTLWCRADNPR